MTLDEIQENICKLTRRNRIRNEISNLKLFIVDSRCHGDRDFATYMSARKEDLEQQLCRL